ILVLPIAVLVWYIAAQGYSVLYLFLLADLLCSAAAVPVFIGLYSTRYNGNMATLATLGGLISGLYFFPSPTSTSAMLLESFLMAVLVPVIMSVIMLMLAPRGQSFNLGSLKQKIKAFNG